MRMAPLVIISSNPLEKKKLLLIPITYALGMEILVSMERILHTNDLLN